MTDKHALYSPSASSRWLNCTGSIHLTKNIQEKPNLYAMQGQAAHTAAEICLRNPALDPLTFIDTSFTSVGPYRLTEEDAEAVDKYVKFMIDEMSNAGEDATVLIERKLKSASISPNLFGTSDAIIISKEGHLKIYDYKHGMGVLVSVKDNSQMYCYALLALNYAKENGIKIKTIEIIIVQPRASDDYISREYITIERLLAFKERVLDKIKEIESTQDNPILNAGETQCRWCPIKAVCPAVRDKNLAVAKAEFTDNTVVLPSPELLTEEELVKILDHADFFRSWLTSIENFMEAQALQGISIPGWKLVPKRAYRKWSDENAVVEFVEEVYPELAAKILTQPTLKSPAQVETLIKSIKGETRDIKLMNLNILQQHIYIPQTQPTLAKETDKRAGVAAQISAREEFN